MSHEKQAVNACTVKTKREPVPMNQILYGDCVELMAKLPDDFIDLIATSPPYGTIRKYGGHPFNPKSVINGLWRITKPGGIVAWVVQDTVAADRSLSGESHEQVRFFRDNGWTWYDEITLVKSGSPFPGSHGRYGPCEKVFIFSKGLPRKINVLRDRENKRRGERIRCTKRRNDKLVYVHTDQVIQKFGARFGWWQYSVGGRPKDITGDHPSRMDERIAADLIRSYTSRGETVFDPMAGSGTTCKAALTEGRTYLGMEIHEPYVKIACERLRMAENALHGRSRQRTQRSDLTETAVNA